MYSQKAILLIRNITPMHVGSGNELGIVDLPIQREGHTDFPKIEASSLKGSLREAFENKLGEDNLDIHLVFGYDEDADANQKIKTILNNTEYAGAVSFSDARILLFPVKTPKGVFAWITCPYALKRFDEDLKIAGLKKLNLPKELNNIQNNPETCIVASNNLLINHKMILEEYSFTASVDTNFAQNLYNYLKIDDLNNKLVIVSDEIFTSFVKLSTEIITRTKINNSTGTVKEGALFNEEYLPAESVLYLLVFTAPIFNTVKSNFTDDLSVMKFIKDNLPAYIQIGGNATLGKGIVKANFMEV
ncbi:type III-B CRISPR module RAMP protein Cmr4 [Rosettibacter firmus]|uniref:type III-B CRISPR module RAMP protein Cmr4 n=1 Tax=Rosettibacter firmus TaxID=3111522 RepID=UPI00336BBB63